MKKRVYILGTLAVGLTVAWLTLVYAPHHRAQERLSREAEEVRQKLNDYDIAMASVGNSMKTHETLRQLRNELDSRLYTKTDVLQLFELLKQQADKQKLELLEISPPINELLQLNRTVPDSAAPQFLNINLKLRGHYTDFGRFVKEIEKSDHFRSIRHCQILRSLDQPEPPSCQLTFKSLLGFAGNDL